MLHTNSVDKVFGANIFDAQNLPHVRAEVQHFACRKLFFIVGYLQVGVDSFIKCLGWSHAIAYHAVVHH